MKKIIFYNILLAGIFMVSSCGEDFLTVVPEDTLTTDTFFKTPEQFKVAVNGAYAPLLGLYSGADAPMYLYGEMRSDNTTFEGSSNQAVAARKQIDQFLETRTSADNFFRDLYQAIARCNVILDYLETSELTDAQKAQYKSETSFLRAFYYLQLVKQWGEVPLVLTQVKNYEEAFAVSGTKASVDAIYTQIIKDATYAVQNFTATYASTATLPAGERGRATKYAAKMLIADAYLTQEKYQLALDQLVGGTDGVISGGAYSLVTTPTAPAFPGLPTTAYAGLWGTANEHNRESIWEINYIQTDTYTGANNTTNQNAIFFDIFGPNDANFTSGGVVNTNGNNSGWGIITTDMLNTFEAGDQRKSLIVTSFTGGNGKTIPYSTKFYSTHTAVLRYGNNFPVYRYAEALLMAAECINKGATGAPQPALFYLNQVRTRAGLPASALAGTALFDQIIHERRVEFLQENKRWFDLLRTGTAVSVMQAFGNAFRADPNNPNPPDITPAGAYQPANILTKLVYPDREVQVLGFTPPVGE